MNLRHGDLILTKLKKVPDNVQKIKECSEFVLAEGEHTGHKHLLQLAEKQESKVGFTIYQDENKNYILETKIPLMLSHEEHKTITIEPGIYIQEFEQEFDYFTKSINFVKD